MHINRKLLWTRLDEFIECNYEGQDKDVLKYLVEKTVMLNPADNCIIKGQRSDWDGLPGDKSLFQCPRGCGLPIGNLTSQVFANFYMNPFDHYMKHDLKLRYYGRYVDDFIIVHNDKRFLKSIIPLASGFLSKELGLTLNPKKIYLQHYSKGVKYLGCVIKPWRIYIANRTKGNFYDAVERFNEVGKDLRLRTCALKRDFRSSVNSYLGIMSHYATYNIRKKELYFHLSSWWRNQISPKEYCKKIKI